MVDFKNLGRLVVGTFKTHGAGACWFFLGGEVGQ